MGFFSIILLVMLPFQQREVVYLEDASQDLILRFNDLQIFVDSTASMSFDDVREEDLFSLQTQFVPAEYCTSCAYWIKVPIVIDQNAERQWVLEFYDQTIDHITAYFPNPDGTYRVDTVGDSFPFTRKELDHKNFEWILNSKVEGKQFYYFRVKSHSYADIRLALHTINHFISYTLAEYFLYGIFYGMIVIIGLYNFLTYLAIGERKYLFYTFYLISVGIYALSVDGIAYQYIWPNAVEWNQIAHGTALFALIIWALVFAQRFLNTSIKAPMLHRLITYLIILRSAFFLYALIFDRQLFEWRSIEIIPLSVIFYSGIEILYKGYKPARLFVIAYGILFTGFLIKALMFFSLIPVMVMSYYSLHVAFLFEMLFLTLALGDRLRILKDNRDRAQRRIIMQQEENVKLKDQLNRELEQLVEKRTDELRKKNIMLEESNQKLAKQTNEISRINSMLDLDNWKLKNNIKEILQDRLINRQLDFNEFRRIFPDKISCYRFLDRLKWQNGFTCIKCGNNKYSDGQSKFSRRCTKCGYDESVTSNTVFHRIRFPVEKAFYILYVTNNRDSNLTLDELAERLDLRRNTVWAFKRKIEKLYKDKHKSKLMIDDLFSAHISA